MVDIIRKWKQCDGDQQQANDNTQQPIPQFNQMRGEIIGDVQSNAPCLCGADGSSCCFDIMALSAGAAVK